MNVREEIIARIDKKSDPLYTTLRKQLTDQKQVPDNAVSIQSPSEAPEDAEVVEGERGGLYYVPSGESDGGGDSESGESTSSQPFSESPEDVFAEVATDEQTAEAVENLSQAWAGWPTDSSTASMWQAASQLTDNENDPGDISGNPLVDNPNVDAGEVEAYQEYKENLEDKLREEHGDSITATRFLHGETAQQLQNGESVQPRTLGSWTTNEESIPELVNQVAPNPDAAMESGVVVTLDIPVENVMDHHAANPTLDDAGQEEVVAALDWSDDLQDGDIQPLSEVSN